MTRVTSQKSISFPKLNWGISAGEEKDLPADKEAQARILAEPDIVPVDGKITTKSDKDTE
jgi:hypothetical protein